MVLFRIPRGGKNSQSILGVEGGRSDCVLDGIEVDCAFIRGETSVQCPDNDCGPKAISYTNEDGVTVTFWTTPFMAFMNGQQGYYLPSEVATPQAQADLWDRVAAAVAAGITAANIYDRKSSGQRRTSMQRRGYTGRQNGFEWTQDELRKKNRAVEIALAALTDPNCESFLRGHSKNARVALAQMAKSNVGFLNRSKTRPIEGSSETIAWTRMPGGLGPYPEVDLYEGFFRDRVEFGLTADQTRALTILHELGHVTRRFFHSSFAPVLGGDDMSDEEVDKAIVDNCFTGPTPSNITE